MNLHRLITRYESKRLRKYIKDHPPTTCRNAHTLHNLIIKWLDGQPRILERFRNQGIITHLGAYALEKKLF